MKYIALLCFYFLVLSQVAFSQWSSQSSGVVNTFYSVFFVDEFNGWAVGDDGIIIRTTDGGNNWSEQVSGTTNYFTSTFFISVTEGWAVGGNYSPFLGMVHYTSDGGSTWTVQTDTLPNQLNSVFFISPTTGWTAGESSQILKTTDGGLNWVPKNAEESDYRDIFFYDENVGWAVGGDPYNTFSTILKTTNGGDLWTVQSAATNSYLRAVFFISETIGWVAGNEGVIFKTTDGGLNWEPQNSGTTGGLYSIYFIDDYIGWMVGGSGIILFTDDGGSTWTVQNSGTNFALNSTCFSDANNGWIVGGYGTILHTSNGGVTFIEEDEINELPTDFFIHQNWPNPFNPTTKINYSIPEASFVTLIIYDLLGMQIKTLVNEEKLPGHYEVEFKASYLPSGVYFYRLQAMPALPTGQAGGRQAGDFIQTRKMLLLK